MGVQSCCKISQAFSLVSFQGVISRVNEIDFLELLPLFNFPYDNSLLIPHSGQQSSVHSYCACAVNKLHTHAQLILSVLPRVGAEHYFAVSITGKQCHTQSDTIFEGKQCGFLRDFSLLNFIYFWWTCVHLKTRISSALLRDLVW